MIATIGIVLEAALKFSTMRDVTVTITSGLVPTTSRARSAYCSVRPPLL